jgi:peroxiredoxin
VPKLIKLHEDYKAKDVVIIGIHVKSGHEKMAEFVDTQKIPYAVCTDDSGATTKRYKVTGIPTVVIIDKKGIVRNPDGEATPEVINKLLAEK